MGFMDKVKAQAEQAMVKAQQGVAQGQTKLDDIQTKRAGDALIAVLGTAYYAQQRQGGSAEAVAGALAAVDAHVATHGPIAAAPAAPAAPPPAAPAAGAPAPGTPAAAPPPTAPTPPAASGEAPAPGGSFSLDDI
ncbi:MAG TPA: hypothetical protein VHW92_09805 [Mycobacteriales bacterium]|jgi:hypothetical protein|nr:hypothetical protein [Mycobacteriales bacterium]